MIFGTKVQNFGELLCLSLSLSAMLKSLLLAANSHPIQSYHCLIRLNPAIRNVLFWVDILGYMME